MNSSPTEKKDVRRFGAVALVFFLLLSGLGLWRGRTVPVILFGALSFLGLLFLLFPASMTPVYEGWLAVSRRIGRLTNALILSLAYYAVITPFALVHRLFGVFGKPLPKRPDHGAASYWVHRSEPGQPRERFTKRY
jgi:hypothetical protein